MHILWLLLALIFIALFGIFVYHFYLFIKKYLSMSYPLPVYHFKVEWGGSRIEFTNVKGLDKYIDPIQVRDGASADHSFQLMPGLEKYNTITLRRTILKGDNDFFEWINTKKGSTIERRDITISLLDENHDAAVVWKIKSAFPIRYSGPIFEASNSGSAFEELEIIHEGMSVQNK